MSLSLPAHAERTSVRAQIVDGVTLAPIPYAKVTFAGRSLVADAQGELVIAIDRAVDVIASAPGYESATQTVTPVTPGTEPQLVLVFKREALEVIQIRAQAPKSVTDGSYTLGRDEIRNLPGGSTDALAAVRSLPGVASSPPVAGGRLVIRGGAPQDSLLTIDGIPVPFLYHSFDNTTILPVAMIGAIAYSPGGFGVEEGRATSGAVGISTLDQPPNNPTATAQLSMLDVSAVGSMPVSKKHGVYLSGGVRRSTVDVLLPLTVPEDYGVGFTIPPRFHDAQLRLDWRATARDRVTLLAFTSYDRAGIVNHMPDSDLPADFDLESDFGRAIATWKHETPRFKNRLVGALGRGELHSKFDAVQYVDDKERLAIVRDDASFDLHDRVRLRAGGIAQVERHELDARAIVVPADGLPPGHFDDLPIYTLRETYDTGYAGAYVSGDVKPTGSTTITGGLRVDHFARLAATVLEPRVEVVQRAGTMKLRASAGRYARDLAQAQALAARMLPELATQVSTGTDIELGRGLVATATVYHTRREQLAVDDPGMTVADELPYASTGTGTTNGAVCCACRASTCSAGSRIRTAASRRDRPGEATHATAFDQSHALTVVGSYRRGSWRFGARMSYATGLPYTDVVGATFSDELGRFLPVLGTPYGTRYPDVAQLDLRVERGWKTKHVDLAAFIDFGNVFRQAHVRRWQYNADFSEKKPLAEYVPLPSIGIRGEL
jgi:hypothetical protein